MSGLDPTGYELTFRDEFNAFSWNSNSDTSYMDQAANGTWSTRFWWGGGIRNLSGNAEAPSEMQWYSDPSVGPNPFSVADGALRITATRSADPAATGNWPYVSGLITTDATFAQQYGYFEMRAKLPAGQGMLPQFYLLPQDHSWPPEIDVMEAFGSEPNRFWRGTHTGPNNDGDGRWVDVSANITNSFHTYGVKWTAETITWYFDGQEVASVATPYDMHKPMYVLANLAIGGPWAGNPFPSTEFPAHMDIDYVRVYSTPPAAAEATRYYEAVLGRPPDAGGLAHWVHAREQGATPGQMADGLVGSAEFGARYGALSNQGFVERLYLNALDRAGDAEGIAHWTAALDAGARSRGDVVGGFAASPEMATKPAPFAADNAFFA